VNHDGNLPTDWSFQVSMTNSTRIAISDFVYIDQGESSLGKQVMIYKRNGSREQTTLAPYFCIERADIRFQYDGELVPSVTVTGFVLVEGSTVWKFTSITARLAQVPDATPKDPNPAYRPSAKQVKRATKRR
jgi:hypothetical protein